MRFWQFFVYFYVHPVHFHQIALGQAPSVVRGDAVAKEEEVSYYVERVQGGQRRILEVTRNVAVPIGIPEGFLKFYSYKRWHKSCYY